METMTERIEVTSDQDVVRVRQLVRTVAVGAKLSLVDQTKVVTAASELARNTLVYGGGGTVDVERVDNGRRSGIRIVFRDQGPASPTWTWPSPTGTPPAAVSGSASAAPAGWWTSSTSTPAWGRVRT